MMAVLKNARAAMVSLDTMDVLQDPLCVNPTANVGKYVLFLTPFLSLFLVFPGCCLFTGGKLTDS